MRSLKTGILCILIAALGCNPSSQTDPALPDQVRVDMPASPIIAKKTTDALPSMPPGKIELPADLDVTSDAIETAETASKIKLPPIDNPATVVVQRPALDDAVVGGETVLTGASMDEILAKATAAGKICVVDFWSLACGPCLEEFPGLVQLHKELGDQVVCISVNVDYDGRKSKPAEIYRSRVEAFLESSGAKFDNFLCTTPSEDVFTKLKIASIPAVLVYDASGQLVSMFTDTGDSIGFTYAKNITPLVRSLVTPLK